MRPGYLRTIFYVHPLIILSTILMASISVITSLWDSTGRAQHAVSRVWSKMLLAIAGVKVEIEGLEKIAPGGSYVFACNHLSYMDTPVILAHIPVQFRFLAKKGLFMIPFLGFHLRRAGHVPVRQEDARDGIRALNTAARLIREQGVSVLIFPEGGRSLGTLQEFKEGAAFVALKSGVPVVPMAVMGTRAILPMESLIFRRGHARLKVGDPIPVAGLELRYRARLTALTRERVVELLGGSEAELLGS